MTQHQISVWLDDAGIGPAPVRVGTLTCPAQRSSPTAFAYGSEWLAHPQAFALEPQLPLVAGHQYPAQGTLHAIFRDSAPDRWGRVLIERREAINAAREQRPVRHLFDLDFLLAVQDSSRMGALRFQAEGGHYLASSEFAVPPVGKLRELQALAQRIQQDGIEQLPENVFTIFSWSPLPRKGGGCKAQTAVGLVARRGFATPQTPPLRGNPSGKAAKGRTRRCPPCPGSSLDCGVRLDCGLLLPCGLHEKIVNTF